MMATSKKRLKLFMREAKNRVKILIKILIGTTAAIGAVFAVIAVLDAKTVSRAHAKSGGYYYFQALTGDDADADKSRWDALYRKNKGYVYGKEPASFLSENLKLLPHVGKVLDLAMGEGRNAVFMARKGYDVTGVDISEVAIRKAKLLARERKVRIKTVTADLNKYRIEEEAYDVILVFYYNQKNLIPQIVKGLKPGGFLVYETNAIRPMKINNAENNAESSGNMLNQGELKDLFKGLELVKHEESDGKKNTVESLIARKPLNKK